jgi:hypothetical protein
MARTKKVPRVKRFRDKVVIFNVTAAEKKLFQSIAQNHHQSFADFVRQLLYRESKASKVA